MAAESAGRRVGRPPLTDQTALLVAARSIGFVELTVGAVTAAAGVKYSTFYRHFARLDALITDLIDQICVDTAPPEPECALQDRQGWQYTVRDTCTLLRETLEQHPGMAEAIVALPRLPTGILAHHARLADTLAEAGLTAEAAAAGAVCAIETVMMTQLSTPGLQHTLTDLQRGDEADRPLQSSARLIERPGGTWTDRKLDLLIRGLEAELDATQGQ